MVRETGKSTAKSKRVVKPRNKGRRGKPARPSKKKRSTAKKRIAKKQTLKKQTANKLPAGFAKTSGGLVAPVDVVTPIPPNKLRKGIADARAAIEGVVDDLVKTMTEEYHISEITLAASFSADGKFMGFGVGGAATVTIKLTPVEAE